MKTGPDRVNQRPPTMQLGITDHIWTIGELVNAALDGVVAPEPKKRYSRFAVIDGGKQ